MIIITLIVWMNDKFERIARSQKPSTIFGIITKIQRLMNVPLGYWNIFVWADAIFIHTFCFLFSFALHVQFSFAGSGQWSDVKLFFFFQKFSRLHFFPCFHWKQSAHNRILLCVMLNFSAFHGSDVSRAGSLFYSCLEIVCFFSVWFGLVRSH